MGNETRYTMRVFLAGPAVLLLLLLLLMMMLSRVGGVDRSIERVGVSTYIVRFSGGTVIYSIFYCCC